MNFYDGIPVKNVHARKRTFSDAAMPARRVQVVKALHTATVTSIIPLKPSSSTQTPGCPQGGNTPPQTGALRVGKAPLWV